MAVLILVLVGSGVIAWQCRATLLTQAVDLWSVSDPVEPADAVAVLGGGLETRPFAAAEYYRSGIVPRILISNERPRGAKRGFLPSDVAVTRTLLVRLGVPENAIEVLGEASSNTYEESLALRRWALNHHAHRVLVPTEYFSSRRVRWIMRHEMAPIGIEVLVPALDDPEYPRNAWWHTEKGIVAFQNELLKYTYYRLKY